MAPACWLKFGGNQIIKSVRNKPGGRRNLPRPFLPAGGRDRLFRVSEKPDDGKKAFSGYNRHHEGENMGEEQAQKVFVKEDRSALIRCESCGLVDTVHMQDLASLTPVVRFRHLPPRARMVASKRRDQRTIGNSMKPVSF